MINWIIDRIKNSWGMFDDAPKSRRIIIGLMVGLIIGGIMCLALSGCAYNYKLKF